MQIDPAALSRSDSITAPLPPAKSLSGSVSGPSSKNVKNVPLRVDEEPVYSELKVAVGSVGWSKYHDALTRFLRGAFNISEFNKVAEEIITTSHLEHLHNNFICAIIFNVGREPPEPGVASWVSANDKPTTGPTSKPAPSGDGAEQRLKTEVMQLPPRDRRRLKGVGVGVDDPGDAYWGVRGAMENYHSAMQMRAPDAEGGNKGGLTKTNWDMEIRKRYIQPLASEVGEFPSASSIYARMVPICYEESVPGGASEASADLVAIAAETYIKECLTLVFHRTRSNAPGIVGMGASAAGVSNGILTSGYKRVLSGEEAKFAKGEMSRGRENGLLPVEAKEAALRRTVCIGDLKVAREIKGRGLGEFVTPYVEEWVADGWEEGEREEWKSMMGEREDGSSGVVPMAIDGEMDGEDEGGGAWGWDGTGTKAGDELSSLLDDCLARWRRGDPFGLTWTCIVGRKSVVALACIYGAGKDGSLVDLVDTAGTEWALRSRGHNEKKE
ncbi:MAG: hypothetical protein Q9160_003678 [Pyrenula sp. 1 TL-2023]